MTGEGRAEDTAEAAAADNDKPASEADEAKAPAEATEANEAAKEETGTEATEELPPPPGQTPDATDASNELVLATNEGEAVGL